MGVPFTPSVDPQATSSSGGDPLDDGVVLGEDGAPRFDDDGPVDPPEHAPSSRMTSPQRMTTERGRRTNLPMLRDTNATGRRVSTSTPSPTREERSQ